MITPARRRVIFPGFREGRKNALPKPVDPTISQAEVRGRYDYNQDTGIFTCKATGKVAGVPNARGYLFVRLGGRNVGLHRLVFMWMYGHWPLDMVDHVNGNPSDNRLVNVRPATATQNAQNKRPYGENNYGYKGVRRRKDGRWQACITVNGHKRLIRGTYESAYAAHRAYRRYATENFKEFARWETTPSNPPVPAHAQHSLWDRAVTEGKVVAKIVDPKLGVISSRND